MMGYDTRAARAAWTIFLVALLIYSFYLIRQTLFIFIFAIFFSYMIYPLVRLLDLRRKAPVPGTLSIAAAFMIVIALFVSVGALLGVQIVQQAASLAQELPRMLQMLNNPQYLNTIPLPSWLEPMRLRMAEFVRAQAQGSAHNILPFIQQASTQILRFSTNLIFIVLIPILSFMFIKDASKIREGIHYWLGPSARKAFWDGILDDINNMLKHYIRTLFILSVMTFIAYSLFFALAGVPYGLLLAGTAAVLEFVPLLGPLVAGAVIFAVSGFSGYPHLLWILIFILAYRVFQDYVLSPYLMGEGVEVPPILVLFGALAGEQIAGIMGMFLSVPVLAAIKIIAEHIRNSSRLELPPHV